MKNRYLKILREIPVYSKHDASSKTIETLKPLQLVSFNREKRRDGINWMEIYLEGSEVAYIKKKADDYFKCQFVELNDEKATGFNFINLSSEPLPPIETLITPIAHFNSERKNTGRFEIESIENASEHKRVAQAYSYPYEKIELQKFQFVKNEQFFITYRTYEKKHILIQVDNLKGKKGYILKATNHVEMKDKWITNLTLVVFIISILAMFVGFLSQGWLVFNVLMVFAAVAIGFIFFIVLSIVMMILEGVFNQIRKRF